MKLRLDYTLTTVSVLDCRTKLHGVSAGYDWPKEAGDNGGVSMVSASVSTSSLYGESCRPTSEEHGTYVRTIIMNVFLLCIAAPLQGRYFAQQPLHI